MAERAELEIVLKEQAEAALSGPVRPPQEPPQEAPQAPVPVSPPPERVESVVNQLWEALQKKERPAFPEDMSALATLAIQRGIGEGQAKTREDLARLVSAHLTAPQPPLSTSPPPAPLPVATPAVTEPAPLPTQPPPVPVVVPPPPAPVASPPQPTEPTPPPPTAPTPAAQTVVLKDDKSVVSALGKAENSIVQAINALGRAVIGVRPQPTAAPAAPTPPPQRPDVPPLPATERPVDVEDIRRQVQEDMAREREKATRDALYARERARVDPVFAQQQIDTRRAERERQERMEQQQRRQTMSMGLGFAGQGLAAAGMPGIGSVVSGMGAANAFGLTGFGAAIAAITLAINKATEVTEQFYRVGSSIASLDATGVARGMADLSKQIPLFGGVLGAMTHGAISIGEGLLSTAQRLSQYSPRLAIQMAEMEIRQIQRDIFRAQTQGPAISRGVESFLQARERFEDFITRNMDRIVDSMEKGLDLLGRILNAVNFVFEQGAQIRNNIVNVDFATTALLNVGVPGLGNILNRMAQHVQEMERMARQRGQGQDLALNDILRLARDPLPLNFFPEQLNPGQQHPMPPLQGGAFGAFGP